ncbi:PREDICTED: uncharacterized protein LOC108376968, partial [Rhagoletis zephyria]|uniref:uncharacterized protein LOC108376968 n=1 Tax=Rhagoletis zephyria TaxID=28612 RepID=UPI000811402C
MFALQQVTTMTAACLLCSILFAVWPKVILCRPSQDYSTDGTELVVVKEIVRCTRQGLHELCQNATTTNEDEEQHTALNADNESVMDVVDDLILLEKKPKSTQRPQPQPQPQQQQQQQQLHQHQRKQTHPYGTYQQQSELLTSAAAREDTLVSAAAAAPAIGDPSDSTAFGSSYHQETFDSDSDSSDAAGDERDNVAANTKTTDVDAVNAAAADEIIADGVLFHGVLLRLADGPHSLPQPVPPVDVSDFVSLMPAEEVKSIAANYYHNDAEVRRAYAYLSGPDFVALRQRIVASPEVGAFLQYLNVSGFDVLKFVSAIANLTIIEDNMRDGMRISGAEYPSSESEQHFQVGTTSPVVNEVSKTEQNMPPNTNTVPTPTLTLPATKYGFDETMSMASTKSPIATTKFDEPTSQQEEQLNGLHGLVDSILEILPQDQILATFFDKLETDENFRKFVNNIQRPAFAQYSAKW